MFLYWDGDYKIISGWGWPYSDYKIIRGVDEVNAVFCPEVELELVFFWWGYLKWLKNNEEKSI